MFNWHCVRVVKELDLNSNGLCPHRFEPCRCRFSIGFFSRRAAHTCGTLKQECDTLFIHEAAIAQLGERQTEDLEVPGSIPGLGMYCPTLEQRAAVEKSEHPESNQGPFDTCDIYSRTLYQLSYVRLRNDARFGIRMPITFYLQQEEKCDTCGVRTHAGRAHRLSRPAP